jgi:hypothetical protein
MAFLWDKQVLVQCHDMPRSQRKHYNRSLPPWTTWLIRVHRNTYESYEYHDAAVPRQLFEHEIVHDGT